MVISYIDMLAQEIDVLWVLIGFCLPKDVMRRDAHHVCSERLQARRQRRLVEGDAELACLPAIDVGRSLLDTSALADCNTLHPFQVSLKRRKRKLVVRPWLPSSFLISSRLYFYNACLGKARACLHLQ
jgi:hypothetical protein